MDIRPICKFLRASQFLMNSKLLKIVCLFLAFLFVPTGLLYAQDSQQLETDPLEDIIAPDLERRVIKVSDIDSENWEFGIFAGAMSIEDFGTNTISGFRMAYHISERFFTEATYGVTEAGETSFELLSGSTQILNEDQRELTYYDLAIGYNLFQGEIFLGSNRAYNTNFYVLAGAGNTDFADDSYFTYSVGVGSRFFVRDWFSVHGDFKAHSFSHELLGEEKSIINLSPNIGLTFYF